MKEVKHFVIVDDDPISNMICINALKRTVIGAQIRSHTKPEAALEEIRLIDIPAAKSTVLFLDINMPNITGWDFLDLYKNFHSDVTSNLTIYILSSSLDSRDRERAISNPLVCGFISKPLTPEIISELFLDN